MHASALVNYRKVVIMAALTKKTAMIKSRAKRRPERWIIRITMLSLLLFLGVFYFFPIFYSSIGSLFDWKPLKKVFEFVGFDNYIWLFGQELFGEALKNTLVFAIVAVCLYIVLGVIFAFLIFSVPRLQGFFRTVYFLPVITASAAVSILWKYSFYNTDAGLFNAILEIFGLQRQMWLMDEKMVLACIIVMTVWKQVGYAIIIVLAGLNEIPQELSEAATIDGANRFKCFRYIALPLLRPTILLVTVTGMIDFLQVFNQIILMTSTVGGNPGGPGTASYTLMLWIYEKAFTEWDFGRASAIGYVLVFIIMIFTLIQFRLNKEE